MMSSLETSSPVSASSFWYLIRGPVFRLIWLKLIFSDSDVAGKRAIGHVTSERRKKPFQYARGAMNTNSTILNKLQYRGRGRVVESANRTPRRYLQLTACSRIERKRRLRPRF